MDNPAWNAPGAAPDEAHDGAKNGGSRTRAMMM